MTRRLRWVWIAPGLLAALALSRGTAGAADQTKVDQATKRVERGAKQIGQGQVGPGFKEMFTGIGHTIVEGAKFSGENIKEFFTAKKSQRSNGSVRDGAGDGRGLKPQSRAPSR